VLSPTIETEAVNPERIAGDDRYETARLLLDEFLPTDQDFIYLATGENYPDALVAAPLAARNDTGILLIDGEQTQLPDWWPEVIDSHSLQRFCLLGGPLAISTEIEEAIRLELN